MSGSQRLCVGEIVTAHGVRGLVKLRSFTADPSAVASYGPLSDEAGRRTFRVTLQSAIKDQWIAKIDGVDDRDKAEALRGTRLYVDRSLLPAPEEDEFYYADLIGLRVETADGGELGRVLSVHDFGAGDMLEVRLTGLGRTEMLPFTREVVPTVDVANGRLIAHPPAGWLDPARPEEEEDEDVA